MQWALLPLLASAALAAPQVDTAAAVPEDGDREGKCK